MIRHIGMSTHNPQVAKLAALSGEIEMLLFSVNPAFDLLPPSEDLNDYFVESYGEGLAGIDPLREELYKLCEQRGVGITVMKGYAGGRLFDARTSPFGVALTPVQCLHYALTRPAVASVLVGYDTPAHVDAAVAYEAATEEERDYASVLAKAPRHAYFGQCTYCGHCAPCPAGIDIAMVNKLYDLAAMQPEVPAIGAGPLPGPFRHGSGLHCLWRLRNPLSLWGARGGAHGKGQGPAGLTQPRKEDRRGQSLPVLLSFRGLRKVQVHHADAQGAFQLADHELRALRFQPVHRL